MSTTNGCNGSLKNKGENPAPLMYNGLEVRPGIVIKDPITHLQNIRALQLRDDDVMIAAFPKCGTHWLAEIVAMLLSGSASYAKMKKESAMLDLLPDLTKLDTLPSPRVLNSHLFFAHLPDQEILRRKIKIIHVTRNPKDVAVSYYHFLKPLANEGDDMTFGGFLKKYTSHGVRPQDQFDYLRQMQEFERSHPDHPIIHVHYEDLKLDPLPVVKSVAEFLGVPASEEFYKQVIDACGFKNLKKNDVGRQGANFEDEKVQSMVIYRKGVIGDWKNTFTVAQSEAFDEIMATQMAGVDVTFRGL